jgi:hypothetical protein
MLMIKSVVFCVKYFRRKFFGLMRKLVLIFCILFSPAAFADLASVDYVETRLEEKVDVSENAKQTLKGEYTITGTLHVPTPPLPPAD